MRLPPPILLLAAGCAPGEPISNAVFYEDELFLAALPSSADLAVPEAIRDAPVDGAVVLAEGALAALALEDVLIGLVASGEALRATPPDERSDVHRAWHGVTVAANTDAGVQVWWVDCVIARPEGGPTTWQLAIGPAADEATVPVAEGTLQTDGSGAMAWDLAAAAPFTGVEDQGDVEVEWRPGEAEERDADVVIAEEGLPTGRAWALAGEEALGWAGRFAVTEDEATWPGWAVAVHLPQGGRARGEVQRSADTLAFEACWDAAGAEVWRGGDAGIAAVGDAASCSAPPFPD